MIQCICNYLHFKLIKMIHKIFIAVLLIAATSSKTIAQTATQPKDTTITIKVKGLTCNNDLKRIATNVTEIKGVTACKPGKLGPTSTYKVTYNTALVNKTNLVTVIENTPGCGDGDEKPYKVKN
jgi:copper chaperone CopZ